MARAGVSWRRERIGEQVRDELSRLVRDELSDPRVCLLTLTRVEVARDLSTASVFWSPLGTGREDGLEEISAGLASAAGFLRKRLAEELSLRRTPELRFRHDRSIELGAEMLGLLRTLEERREADESLEADHVASLDESSER